MAECDQLCGQNIFPGDRTAIVLSLQSSPPHITDQPVFELEFEQDRKSYAILVGPLANTGNDRVIIIPPLVLGIKCLYLRRMSLMIYKISFRKGWGGSWIQVMTFYIVIKQRSQSRPVLLVKQVAGLIKNCLVGHVSRSYFRKLHSGFDGTLALSVPYSGTVGGIQHVASHPTS